MNLCTFQSFRQSGARAGRLTAAAPRSAERLERLRLSGQSVKGVGVRLLPVSRTLARSATRPGFLLSAAAAPSSVAFVKDELRRKQPAENDGRAN